MTCLYESIVDNLIRAFMHMAIYMYWLKGGLIEKGLDHFYLRLKVVAESGDPTDLEDAMMEFLGATNLHT